ncbi:hypothetical protein DMENIID0001_163370 [Sergentomyia squamirostris]
MELEPSVMRRSDHKSDEEEEEEEIFPPEGLEDDDEADDEEDDIDEELREVDEEMQTRPSSASSDDLDNTSEKDRLTKELLCTTSKGLASSHSHPYPAITEPLKNRDYFKMSTLSRFSLTGDCTILRSGGVPGPHQKLSMNGMLRRIAHKIRRSNMREAGVAETHSALLTNNNNIRLSNLNICVNGGASKDPTTHDGHKSKSTYHPCLPSNSDNPAIGLNNPERSPGTAKEKEKKLNEMILQLQLVRDLMRNQTHDASTTYIGFSDILQSHLQGCQGLRMFSET